MSNYGIEGVASDSAGLKSLAPGIILHPPLLKCAGRGPPLILITASSLSLQPTSDVPEPPQKWAEEGFTVVKIQNSVCREVNDAQRAFSVAESAFEECTACEGSKIGVLGR